MKITTLLFDADGVLQRPVLRWDKALEPILRVDERTQLGQCIADILDAERVALVTSQGFTEALQGVLAKWRCVERMPEVLQALNAIYVYDDVMQVVQSVREAGIRWHIASNQQTLRAQHMSEVLGYKRLFEREFYSCFIGTAKPDSGFFAAVLDALQCRRTEVLFVDDLPDNVDAAKRAGLNATLYSGSSGAITLRNVLAEHGISVDGVNI